MDFYWKRKDFAKDVQNFMGVKCFSLPSMRRPYCSVKFSHLPVLLRAELLEIALKRKVRHFAWLKIIICCTFGDIDLISFILLRIKTSMYLFYNLHVYSVNLYCAFLSMCELRWSEHFFNLNMRGSKWFMHSKSLCYYVLLLLFETLLMVLNRIKEVAWNR